MSDNDFLATSARAKATIAARNEQIGAEVARRGEPYGEAFAEVFRAIGTDQPTCECGHARYAHSPFHDGRCVAEGCNCKAWNEVVDLT